MSCTAAYDHVPDMKVFTPAVGNLGVRNAGDTKSSLVAERARAWVGITRWTSTSSGNAEPFRCPKNAKACTYKFITAKGEGEKPVTPAVKGAERLNLSHLGQIMI